MKKISICIPTYEMHGKAKELLIRNFNILKKQTYQNFEVIISDNSEDDVVKNLCQDPEYKSLNIKYSRNPRKGLSANTNESIKKATGDLIKILYMDDYFANENSLEQIVKNFTGFWLVTGCGHDDGNSKITNEQYPIYSRKISRGKNTIGSPSVLTIKNEDLIFFDENLSWVLDCDYYSRLYEKYGNPTILNEINVIIGTGQHQTTFHLKFSKKLKEILILLTRYILKNLIK